MFDAVKSTIAVVTRDKRNFERGGRRINLLCVKGENVLVLDRGLECIRGYLVARTSASDPTMHAKYASSAFAVTDCQTSAGE